MDKCPMTGLPCLHKKCIHVTEVANYQATETKDMCILCGIDHMAAEGGPAFNPNVQQVFQMINAAVKDPTIKEDKIVIGPGGCPTCGHTLEEILMTGKIGCGNCYDFYKAELMPLIEKCQAGNQSHVGKKPKTKPEKPMPNKIPDLEKQLQEAIKDENYALCAKLRDEIKRLKGSQS